MAHNKLRLYMKKVLITLGSVVLNQLSSDFKARGLSYAPSMFQNYLKQCALC